MDAALVFFRAHLPQIDMDPAPRRRSASHSTDDLSLRLRSRRFFQRHHPNLSAHSLHHPSALSTPTTSPSTGHSSPFPGSLSSATSESAPSPEFRSELGLLTSRSSAYSSLHGSFSSRSSHPVSPLSPPTSDPLPRHFSYRPSTAPQSPLSCSTPTMPSDHHHSRSHSRLTVSIKNLLSRSPAPHPSRFSPPSDRDPSSSCSSQVPASPAKWFSTPRKSRPPNLDVSGPVPPPAVPSPRRGSNSPLDTHRRYASDAPAKLHTSSSGSVPPPSQASFDLSSSQRPSLPLRGRDSKTRNVLRRRPSGSAKPSKHGERGLSSRSRPLHNHSRTPPNDGSPSTELSLTPAGAVVEAYKQQSLHRDDLPSPPKLSVDARMSPRTSHPSSYDHRQPSGSSSPTPYCIVFGSSPERRLQACSPDDQRPGSSEADHPTSRSKPSHRPSASDLSNRALTHQLSNRWRKVKGGGVTYEDSPGRDTKGRLSIQEMWRSDKTGMRSTGRSMDGPPNSEEGIWSGPTEGLARSESEKGPDGGKIRRLMGRLSTGGLRDRFSSNKVIPPVPAIPKDLVEKMEQSNSEPTSHEQDQTRLSMAPRNIVVSVAVASLSSNSSDVASMHFFSKTHSSRSSISSYGEAALDRRIIAPIEQLRLDEDLDAVSRAPRRSASVPTGLRTEEGTESEQVPLPSPPRQICPAGESPSCVSSPPSSACASPRGSPQASHGQSRMADGTVSLSPPPRPARSSRRVGSETSSHSIKQLNGVLRQMGRKPSARSDATARPESPGSGRGSWEDPDQTGLSPARTHITFRELSAPRRPPLSEQEKVDIWNDLLDRSEKAGGTLRLDGAAELMSDSMRFSMHSED